MVKFENTEVMGWEHAIRGMRNPMNSWEKGDSEFGIEAVDDAYNQTVSMHKIEEIGPNDYELMKKLRNAGTDHRKFMRMIAVYVDITAPLYWWKEFDTYKVGTVANSCSTMHKIAEKEFTLEDFSHEHLTDDGFKEDECLYKDETEDYTMLGILDLVIDALNINRLRYLNITKELKEESSGSAIVDLKQKQKKYWWQMIQLLPSSYNQRRTVQLNYEVLANIYKSRRNHKLSEWSEGFMNWIKSLPYSELITGEFEEKEKE